MHDVRYALRTLLKSRGFAVVAILAIALGLGANTAIFTIVNAVLLKPFAYRAPGQLILIQERLAKIVPQPVSVPAPDVADFARYSHTLQSLGAFRIIEFNLSGSGSPRRIEAARASASLFPMLGVSPMHGRTFTEDEDRKGTRVALLSYGLWRSEFGGADGIIGKTILLDGEPYQITGIMPRDFVLPPPGTPFAGNKPPEVWVPMSFTPKERADVVDDFDYGVLARVKDGVSVRSASADLMHAAKMIEREYPQAYRNGLTLEAVTTPLAEAANGPARPLLLAALGAVGFLLLIACTNMASLMLSRASGRKHELAVRSAIGASRNRLLRQLLTESVLISMVGGFAGVVLAFAGIDGLVGALPPSIPHPAHVSMDLRVLGFSALLCVLTGLAFGAIPAFASARGDVSEELNRAGTRTSAGRRERASQSILIVAEIALSIVLLTGASLMIRSYVDTLRSDPGFQPENVLSFSVSLPSAEYKTAAQIRSFYRNAATTLARIPGVAQMGIATSVPLGGSNWNRVFAPEGWDAGKSIPLADYTAVDLHYFQALGIRLIAGRYLDEKDTSSAPRVIVVNESLARRYWPSHNAIGKRVRFGTDKEALWTTVVGVVADAREQRLDLPANQHIYAPLHQLIDQEIDGPGRSIYVVLRARLDPSSLEAAARSAVARLDGALPLADLQTMTQSIDETLKARRFSTTLLVISSGLALFLALIGIYAVLALAVIERTREIGIRMALGAIPQAVFGDILREGALLTAAGLAAGGIASILLTRYLSTLLFNVKPTDPISFAVAALVLAVTALAATAVPALRAMRVDPIKALRTE